MDKRIFLFVILTFFIFLINPQTTTSDLYELNGINKTLSNLGIDGMRIDSFSVDGNKVSELSKKTSSFDLKNEFRKNGDGIEQDIYLKNTLLINKNFSYSTKIEIDYNKLRWNGIDYYLNETPIILSSVTDKLTNLTSYPNIFIDDKFNKRINYRDLGEKGGYAKAYKEGGAYYIELMIDKLEIDPSENYFIDPLYYNDTDGFSTASAGAGAPTGIALNGTDFFVLDAEDYWIYKFDSGGNNQTGVDIPPYTDFIISPVALEMNATDFWVYDMGTEVLGHFNVAGTNLSGGFSDKEFLYGASKCMATNGTDYWITESADDFLYHLNFSGYNMSDGFKLGSAGNSAPRGVVKSGDYFWVLDVSDLFMYKYNLAGVNQSDGFSFAGFGATALYDIAYNGSDFWVPDNIDTFVYHFTPRDIGKPVINVITPINLTNSSNKGLDVNYTRIDPGLDSCWYSNTSGVDNYTLASCSNITAVTWLEGINNVTIWANDSLGNLGKNYVTFTIDTINPGISIATPTNLTNTTDTSLDVNYTYSDAGVGVDSCWYSNTSGVDNYTLASCSNITAVTWLEGINNITVWINDSAGNVNQSYVSFNVDSVKPEMTITFPTNTTYNLSSVRTPTTINYTFTETNPDSCWYSLDKGVTNQTPDTMGNNFTNIAKQVAGEYSWAIYCNDTFGNENLTSIDFTIVDDPLMTICNDLITAGGTYILQNNVTSDGTCFNITADNITLDGNGYTINYSYNESGYSVYVNGFDSFTLENINIIMKNTSLSHSHGVYIINSENNIITDVNMTLTGTSGTSPASGKGILLDQVNNTLINNSIINSTGGAGYAVFVETSSAVSEITTKDILIINSHLYSTGSSNNPLYIGGFSSGLTNITVNNTELFSSTEDGIFLNAGTHGDGNSTFKNLLINVGSGVGDVGFNFDDSDYTIIENVNISGNVGGDFDDGTYNLTNVTYIGEISRAGSTVIRNWYLNVQVNETDGSPFNNANVSAYNSSADFQFSVLTDATGKIAQQTVIDYINVSGTTNSYNDYSINITYIGYEDNNSAVTISSNQNLARTLSGSGAPTITLDAPTNNTNFSSQLNVDFNFTATDLTAVDTCRLYGDWNGSYSINETFTSVTSGIQVNTKKNLTDGTYTWTVWCNDSFDNSNFSSTGNLTFTIDSTNPDVKIVIPSENLTNSSDFSYPVNYTFSDANIDSCWWEDHLSGTNLTQPCGANVTGPWATGLNGVTIWINDSAGNINYSSISFTIDAVSPNINISNIEMNKTNISNINIDINYTWSDATIGVEACWYSNDTMDINTTLANCGNLTSIIWSEGQHNVTIWANDSAGNVNKTARDFTIDSTLPDVEVINVTTTTGSQTVTFNVTNYTELYCDSAWYSVYDSTGSIDGVLENISLLSCDYLNSTFVVSGYASFNLTVYMNDSAGNENSTSQNFTTTASPIPPSGGGGGATIQETSTVCFSVSNRTGLDRCILFARYWDFCNEKFECILNESSRNLLKTRIAELNVDLTERETDYFLKSYNNADLEVLKMSDSNIKKYNLFTGILQIEGLGFKITPSRLDTLWVAISDSVSYSILSNRKLENCTIINNNFGWSCISNKSFATLTYNLSDKDFNTKVITTTVSYTSDEGENIFQEVQIRVLNPNFLMITGGIIALFSIVIILKRKYLKKQFKKYRLFPIIFILLIGVMSASLCENTYNYALDDIHYNNQEIQNKTYMETGIYYDIEEIDIYIDNWEELCSELIGRTINPDVACNKIFYLYIERGGDIDNSSIDSLSSEILIKESVLDNYIKNYGLLCTEYSETLPKFEKEKVIEVIENNQSIEKCEPEIGGFFDVNLWIPEVSIGKINCDKVDSFKYFVRLKDNSGSYVINGIKIWFFILLFFIFILLVIIGIIRKSDTYLNNNYPYKK